MIFGRAGQNGRLRASNPPRMHPSVLLANLPPCTADSVTTDLASALCSQAPRLRRLVHRLLGLRANGHELDDLVQDVLLKAWQARASFRGEATLSTWLTRIAMTTTASHVRRRGIARRLFGWLGHDVAAPGEKDDPDAVPELVDLLGCSRGAVDARLTRARHRLRELLPETLP